MQRAAPAPRSCAHPRELRPQAALVGESQHLLTWALQEQGMCWLHSCLNH